MAGDPDEFADRGLRDPTSLKTLILFWTKMEMLHYPGASDTKTFLEQEYQQQQQQQMMMMQQQMAMQQQQMEAQAVQETVIQGQTGRRADRGEKYTKRPWEPHADPVKRSTWGEEEQGSAGRPAR